MPLVADPGRREQSDHRTEHGVRVVLGPRIEKQDVDHRERKQILDGTVCRWPRWACQHNTSVANPAATRITV